MLDFRDFVPQVINPGRYPAMDSFWKDTNRYQSFEDAVQAADSWMRQNCIRVTNIETVVLPNIWSPTEEGSQDAALAGTFAPWHQFVRVWFNNEADPLPP
jgi:hypothetical protein